jgi:histone H3/H4
MLLTYQAAKRALRTNKGLKVSNEAVVTYIASYLEWARKVAEEATAIAESYSRHTVLDRDVELAVKRVAKRESI